MWLLTLILGAIIIFLINYWINSKYEYWKRCGIPYLKSGPFSIFIRYIFTKKGLLDLMLDDYRKLEGNAYAGFFQMFTPSVMIRDPALIHQICVKDFSYFVDRNLPTDICDIFSESVSNMTGDRWRTLRHKITPTFTSGKLKMMFKPIKENSDEVVAHLDEKYGQDIEVRTLMFKFIINVIGNVAFGLKVDALNEETEKNNEFFNVSRLFFQPSFMMMVKFLITVSMPGVRKYIKFSLIDKRAESFFEKLVTDIIKHRRESGVTRHDFLQIMLDHKNQEEAELLAKPNLINSSDHLESLAEQIAQTADEPEDNELLDQLKYMRYENSSYKNTKVFTDKCIIAQTFLFISGGSETISLSLSFVLYELAIHPEVQKKLQKEIDDAISKNGFNYDSMKIMTYMDQVITESMRIHSPTPFIARVCTQDYKIPNTDVTIEKGAFITIPVSGLNHDPQYFHDPEKFDPDRFEDKNSIPQSVLLSFGLGPRMCIAKRWALLKMKILLATLLQQFNIVLSKKTKLPLTILKSSAFQYIEGGLWLKFQRRN